MAENPKNKIAQEIRELDDAALDAELEAERKADRARRAGTLRTVLAGVCGTLCMAVVLVVVSLLFIRIPPFLFVGTAPLIWLFTKLFRGDTGKPMLIAAAVGTALACVFGACLHAAGLFMVYGNLPLKLFPYVTSVILSTSFFWGTFGDGALFALIFSALGFVITWQLTANPFPFWNGKASGGTRGKKRAAN